MNIFMLCVELLTIIIVYCFFYFPCHLFVFVVKYSLIIPELSAEILGLDNGMPCTLNVICTVCRIIKDPFI